MEIEVGEFVRTNKGIIDKVERYSLGCNVWHCKNGMCIDECNVTGVYLKDIVKHSKQLIDLIEERRPFRNLHANQKRNYESMCR